MLLFQYKAIITNVVDGDTFDMDIDLGFHIHIHERVRLLDIDTPEKFGKEKELGLIVKNYAKMLLNKEVIIKSEKAGTASETDSFGRWLVRVIIDDEKDLLDIYNALGINKKCRTYSEENVLKLNTEVSFNEASL